VLLRRERVDVVDPLQHGAEVGFDVLEPPNEIHV
jgi:hypothetical protein